MSWNWIKTKAASIDTTPDDRIPRSIDAIKGQVREELAPQKLDDWSELRVVSTDSRKLHITHSLHFLRHEDGTSWPQLTIRLEDEHASQETFTQHGVNYVMHEAFDELRGARRNAALGALVLFGDKLEELGGILALPSAQRYIEIHDYVPAAPVAAG